MNQFAEVIVLYFFHFIVVMVTFGVSSYSYGENTGTVNNIVLMINTTIAQPLSVSVTGGKYSLLSFYFFPHFSLAYPNIILLLLICRSWSTAKCGYFWC